MRRWMVWQARPATAGLLSVTLVSALAAGTAPAAVASPTSPAAAGAVAARPVAGTAGDQKKPRRNPPPSARTKAPKPVMLTQFTPTTKAVQQAGGKTRVEFYSQPHFGRTKAGWQELSGALTPTTGEVAVKAEHTARPMWFGASAANLLQIRLPQGNPTISLPGARIGKPVVTQAKGNHFVTYKDIATDTDLVYDVHGPQVKEKLILRSAAAPTQFTFHLADPKKLLGSPTRTAFDGYRFSQDIADGIHLELAAPQAWQQGHPIGLPGTAHQSLTPAGDGYDITLSVDPRWMSGKTFPIVLDPTLNYTFADATLSSAYAPIGATACAGAPCPLSSTEYGIYTVANDPTLGPIRAYFHVDLSNIPAQTLITSGRFAQGFNYEWVAKEDLHAVTTLLGAGSTGADLAAATDPQILGSLPARSYSSYGSSASIDITKKIRSWLASGSAADAGLTLKLADEQTQNPNLSTTFSAPSLVVDYIGAPLPPPIPLEQGFGCDCRWVHGAGVTGKSIDPINTAAGAPMESAVDLPAPPAPGIAASFGRTYNGADTSAGPMGAGWTHDFNATLRVEPLTGNITFRDPTGGVSRYVKQLDASYLGDPGITATLTGDPTTGWTLKALSGESITFNPAGQATTDRDRLGQGLSLGYASDRLDTVTDSLGHTLTLAYGTAGAAAGLLTEVSASDGRSTAYGYTTLAGSPHLTSVTGIDAKTTTLTYDATTGSLTGISDPNNHTSARNVYDPTTGRVTQQRDATGATWDLSWDPATQTQSITDPRGKTSYDVYYGNVLTKHVAADGAQTSYYYDGNLNQSAVVDPRGNITQMTYDGAGNMLTRVAPAPFFYTENWSYDEAGQVLTHDGPDGSTYNTYDTAGRLIEVDHGGTTTYTYTQAGQVATVTDRLGKTTTYGYNGAGDRVAITDPLGHITSMGYNAKHQMTSRVDPRGNIPGCNCSGDYTASWTYDDAGRTLTETDPLGRATTYTYDDAGNQLTGTDNASHTTSYTYDAANRVITSTDPRGKTITNTYDLAGSLTQVQDPLGRVISYTTDATGRVLTRTAPAGNVTGATQATKDANTTTYTYDQAGNQTSSSVPDPTATGQTLITLTKFDELNRPTDISDPLGHTTTTSYDAGGRVSSVTNPTGGTAFNSYDYLGRLERTVSPAGDQTQFSYDAEGHLTDMYDPAGGDTSWTYDDAGRVATKVDPRGGWPCNCQADYTTTYGYDAAGQPTSVTDALGHAATSTYNAAGQADAITNRNGGQTSYGYNNVGLLNTVTSPTGDATTYTYDAAGSLSGRTDPRLHATTFGYDDADQLSAITTAAGQAWTYGYDANGNRTTTTVPSGNATSAAGDGTITSTFDPIGRRTAAAYSDGTPTITWGYDKASRVTAMSDGLTASLGPVTLTYDNAGRPLTRTRGTQTFTYTYDQGGRVASRTYPDTTQIDYQYWDGRLSTQTWNGADTTFGYDLAGNLTSTSAPNGTLSTRTYDHNSQLTALTTTNSASGDISAFTQTLDNDGNPTHTTTTRPAGQTSAVNTYDADGRLTNACYADPCVTSPASPSISYGYDANSNRTQTIRAGVANPGTTNSTYDNTDQLSATTDANDAPLTSYSYDPDGHQIGASTPTGSTTFAYNLADQLTSVTPTTGDAASYTYDGDRNRATAAINGTTQTAYTWDLNNPLPQLATETDPTGTLQRRYIHGPTGPLAETTPTATGWYTQDPQSNITDVTDNTGTNLGSYTYEPFGDLRDRTGTDPLVVDNPIRFDAQYQDNTTGLYNNRARQYDPTTGRFTSLDPLAPAANDPYIASYVYAGNRPTVLDDPAGLMSVAIGGGQGSVSDLPEAYGGHAGGTYLAGLAASQDPYPGVNWGPSGPPQMRTAETPTWVKWTGGGVAVAATSAACFFGGCEAVGLTAGSVAAGLAARMEVTAAGRFCAGLITTVGAALDESGAPAPIAAKTGAEVAEDVARSPSFIVRSNGETLIVPKGATGPSPVKTGNGFQFKGGSGGHGLSPRTTDVRIMDPVLGGKHPYPNGYASYSNGSQTVNPFTGQTVGHSSEWWHMGFGQ
jgi:RHS repeat-associated protein